MFRFVPTIFAIACAVALRAGSPSFKLGDIELPADCAALKPEPPLSPEDAARNGYRHVEAIARMLAYPEKKNTGELDPNRFHDLHLKLNGGAPTGIMIAKAKLLLRRHADALAEWDAWLAAPFCREPAVPVYYNELVEKNGWIPHFIPLREALFANLWRMRVALYEGRQGDAFTDWLRCREGLSRHAKDSTTLVSEMIVAVLERKLSEMAWELSPSAGDSIAMPADGEAFDADRWRRVLLSEARLFVVGIPRSEKEIDDFLRTPGLWAENHPKTRAEFQTRVVPVHGTPAERAREFVEEISRLGGAGVETTRVFRYRLSVESPYSKRCKALMDAGIGMDVSTPGLAYLGDWNFRLHRRFDRVIVALRAYAVEHNGEYPKSLDKLVPAYLSALPLDPFSEKPFLYDSRWPAVWSVGPDFKDDGAVDAGMGVRFDDKEPKDIVTKPRYAPAVRPAPPTPPKQKDGTQAPIEPPPVVAK